VEYGPARLLVVPRLINSLSGEAAAVGFPGLLVRQVENLTAACSGFLGDLRHVLGLVYLGRPQKKRYGGGVRYGSFYATSIPFYQLSYIAGPYSRDFLFSFASRCSR
jgi:hypothetical protein